jgi:ERCC4-type nuclease
MSKRKATVKASPPSKRPRNKKKGSGKSKKDYTPEKLPKVTVNDLAKIKCKVESLVWDSNYTFELWVDTQEPPQIQEYLQSLGNFVHVIRLPEGDYWFVLKHKTTHAVYLYMVIERKTISDLGSSIQSDRFRSQKKRLFILSRFLSMPSHRILYLIENCFVHENYFCGHARLKGSLLNIMMRDHMSVFQTSDTLDTIYVLMTKINKTKEHLTWNLARLSRQKPIPLENFDFMSGKLLDEDDILKNSSCNNVEERSSPSIKENAMSQPLPNSDPVLPVPHQPLDAEIIKNFVRLYGREPHCTCHDPKPSVPLLNSSPQTDAFLATKSLSLYVPVGKKSQNQDEIFIAQLRRIPQIGEEAAKAISLHFQGRPLQFYDFIQRNRDTLETALQVIKLASGQKLSKTAMASLLHFYT